MAESLALLGVITAIVFLLLHDVFQFFLSEKGSRVYWFKWWVVLSLIFGFVFWIILQYTGK